MVKSFRMSARGGLLVAMALALVFAGAFVPGPVLAVAVAPDLGDAGQFAVLAYSTVTNTGSTVITKGDVGVYPMTSITGFPPGLLLDGDIVIAGAHAMNGQTALAAAYVELATQPFDYDYTATPDLAGETLTPGVYHFDSTASIGGGGTLTLDAQDDSTAVWIFQIGSTLTTSSSSTVQMANNGSACNVFWQVGTSATIGSSTTFVGDILAMESITVNTSATTTGRLLARTGAVTLQGNTMTPCDAELESSLAILKFHDTDGNGDFDLGVDIPLPGWQFAVSDSTPAPILGSPFTTNQLGLVVITGLAPGDYTVTETPGKAGWVATTDNPQTGTVVDGAITTLEFGNELEEGVLGIFKFNDLNGDESWDSGEPPLENWEFVVADGVSFSQTYYTDASGYIVVIGLAGQSDYTVTETVQSGWMLTTLPNPKSVSALDLAAGAMLSFGNQQEGQGILTIFKFNDVDGDGTFLAPGDAVLGGWDFDITGPDAYSASGTTDGTGLIILTGLMPGLYTVTEVLEFGWTPTTDDSQDATVSNTSDERLDFGNRFTYVPPPPVGGEASPVNKVGLLMPWLILMAVVAGVAMVARRGLRSYR